MENHVTDHLNEIGAEDVMSDPTKIFNGDETSFCMSSKTGKIIGLKGYKNVYNLQVGNGKETFTVLLVFSADGQTITPMVV